MKYVSAQHLELALKQLYTDSVEVAAIAITDPAVAAFAAEYQALGNAVTRRKNEFAAGRTAARKALSGISFPAEEILIGAHRQPLPPTGSHVSISHDDKDAIAVAGAQQHWLGLGVDICDADSLSQNLIETICRGQDLVDLASGESVAQRAKLVFCLKEALFKAIFPQVEAWMEFSQSELCIDHSSGSYGAKFFCPDGSELVLKGQWFGRFACVDNRWLAAAGMRRSTE